MYTLCVIDMQDWFDVKPNTRVANNCEREIRKAVQDGAGVLLVEYQGSGPTIPQLANLSGELPHGRILTIEKYSDNGAKEISQAIWRHSMNSSYIKVAGVNTDCCVYRTCNGLIGYYPHATIEVVADACDSTYNHYKGVENCRDLGCRISNYP